MYEFTHNGHQYRAGRLSAMEQFHVSRRISPLIPPLIPIFLQMARDTKDGQQQQAANLDQLASLFQPFTDGLASMKDADAEYVLSTCLSVVMRRVADTNNWTPIWNKAAKRYGRLFFRSGVVLNN